MYLISGCMLHMGAPPSDGSKSSHACQPDPSPGSGHTEHGRGATAQYALDEFQAVAFRLSHQPRSVSETEFRP
jgi:hypothetical protein